IFLAALADSSINITVRAWVPSSEYWNVFFSVNEKIYARLPEQGFSFPFPQLDVHVVNTPS
ncbi:MAG: mechanosensitive ion channel, partial [Muribaculaceae bacterium]|nr:mechanosensitive ion channel [Muribaculaceae bacterium]